MKRKTYSPLLAGLVCYLIMCAPGLWSTRADADDSKLAFKWALLHRESGGEEKLLDFKKKPMVRTGDQLKLFIQPMKNAYIYFYLLDSMKDLSLLFPHSMDDFGKDYSFGREYFIPTGNHWFSLDKKKGVETFYLIASKERLTSLEAVTREYLNASAGVEKKAARAKVLDEIKKTRRQFSRFATFAEKPVPVAGGVRGMKKKKISESAHYVEANGFYSKTLRLEHK